MTFVSQLKPEAKSIILDEFISNIEKRTKKNGGFIMGTNQIIDEFEHIAISLGFTKCPYCGRDCK